MTTANFAYQGKIAGAALLLSILSIAIGLGIVAAQGRLYGLAAASTQAPTGEPGPALTDTPARAATSPLDTASSSPTGATIVAPSGEGACFAQFFSDVPVDRVKSVEVGAPLLQLIGPSQPKDIIFALKFTDFNQPLGAIKVILFPENEIFKVISLVDANCQEIETFSNTSGGDRRVLSSSDGLQVRFGDREYVLQLIYDSGGAGEIWLGYFQLSGAP